jgi:hypothetical protein
VGKLLTTLVSPKWLLAVLLLVVTVVTTLFWSATRETQEQKSTRKLLEAIRTRDAMLARIALKRGADPNARLRPSSRPYLESDQEAAEEANREPTMLMLAVMYGDVGVVRALVEAGADVEATDNAGGTVLDWAGTHHNVASIIKAVKARSR